MIMKSSCKSSNSLLLLAGEVPFSVVFPEVAAQILTKTMHIAFHMIETLWRIHFDFSRQSGARLSFRLGLICHTELPLVKFLPLRTQMDEI
jgi:hypothetical protein